MSGTPCLMQFVCRNSPFISGEAHSKCALCRLSPDNEGINMAHFWSPTRPARETGVEHQLLVKEKRDKKIARNIAKLAHKRGRDKNKRRVLARAALAERTTEKEIIHATKNSGRQNKDGDHVSLGCITLDTKLQTTRVNPVIYLHELEKVHEDAMRSGKMIGGLVIRNKHNVGVVVLSIDDYVLLTKGLKDERMQQ